MPSEQEKGKGLQVFSAMCTAIIHLYFTTHRKLHQLDLQYVMKRKGKPEKFRGVAAAGKPKSAGQRTMS